MKLSKYTKLLNYNRNYYIYNSISNFLCKIDKNIYNILIDKDKDIEIDDESVLELLTLSKIITNSEKDDLLEYIASIQFKRRINNILNLTLAPTMDCNFNCPYCFEEKEKGVMSEMTIDNIILFIENSIKNGIENLNLVWFGGEPLLVPQIIKTIYFRIKKLELKTINSSIITNGYYLNDENLKLLNDCDVSFIQVSMDGIFESHNKKRFSKTDKDTFSTILSNIDNFNTKGYEIHLGIRMNIDSDNIETYPEIHNFFVQRYKENKYISINPAFIIDTTKSDNDTAINNGRTKFAFNKLLLDQFNNSSFIYPDNMINECAIRNVNTWSIDAKGDVYKCWEIIGNKDYKIGELTDKGINVTNQKMLNRYLFGADVFEDPKCLDCFSLPICGGGCPHKRIENKFNNRCFDNCTLFNNNFDDYLIERIKLYESGK